MTFAGMFDDELLRITIDGGIDQSDALAGPSDCENSQIPRTRQP